ncbi:hypothetical protein HG535_0H03220 [Zygotorulaspora mrakii]|uniref:Uncharacterized protein n=1 Tax=Zygotorulaspora mrakii TaxID=42260 RepID=A0A7H9B8I4_ZYGMR|nr:uncharacterized protein HG535_0H03220 [Zygotorulaspora mrakii]QLG74995.1 hypothetical protein HG535_0H03220 [Zygotorulaspora mrakii]
MQLEPIQWNAENISGIAGSISIACWVIVFVPQIYENFVRKSSDGLSLLFVILWLAGDIFNLVGAMMQHLLPTMIILAAYYTVADIILLIQCLWYGNEEVVDPVHLSPANPISETQPLLHHVSESHDVAQESDNNGSSPEVRAKRYLSDSVVVCVVVLSGFFSWYISYCNNPNPTKDGSSPEVEINWLAQIFGYASAVLYLGSRVPQILLNFERKSCEGISFLFFLFACLGNTTFIISVLAISVSPRYLLVNASWLVGSSGTLIMDFIIFIQFFLYHKNNKLVVQESA